MQAKVSMVVPCYNKEEYIAEMLQSVYDQTWDNIELILVYDKSPDCTREVIGVWLPRLKERGYEVCLLERERPLGLPAAVRDGMLVMTGDFFCTVDCDDVLHPEYVSEMAGWLEANPDYDWVACDFEPLLTQDEDPNASWITRENNKRPTPADAPLMENYLWKKIVGVAWIYMVKSAYLQKCGVIDSFCIEPKESQEPSIIIPLAAGGGKIHYIEKKLHLYRQASRLSTHNRPYPFVKKHMDAIFEQCDMVLSKINAPKEDIDRWRFVNRLSSLKFNFELTHRYFTDDQSKKRPYSDELVSLINTCLKGIAVVSAEQLQEYNSNITYILDQIRNTSYINPVRLFCSKRAANISGRIIGLCALGRVARARLPRLAGTDLMPTVLWDQCAKPDSISQNISVLLPDYDSLTEKDTVIVFSTTPDIVEALREKLRQTKVGAIFFDHDLKEYFKYYDRRWIFYMSSYLYPCKRLPEKVSMVVPCFNKELYIDEMLESIWKQHWDNIEVILVDDGSTDDTPIIIQRWIPRLEGRGYSVILIQQQNQGVAAAVRNGMQVMTGTYFCTADCDDVLHPEYVSTMVSFLETNPWYEMAACNYETLLETCNGELIPAHIPITADGFGTVKPNDIPLLENRLLQRVMRVVWIYMVRTDYVRKCKILENFYTENNCSQEASVTLPLAGGGGKVFYFEQPLYKYRQISKVRSSRRSYEDAIAYINEQIAPCLHAVRNMEMEEGEKNEYELMVMLDNYRMCYNCALKYNQSDGVRYGFCQQLVDVAAELFSVQLDYSPEYIESIGFHAFWRAICAQIFPDSQNPINRIETMIQAGRIIGFGAKGRVAQARLPQLKGTPLYPDVLWDQVADGSRDVEGRPIYPPNLTSLSHEDTVIIFPKDETIINEGKNTLVRHGITKILIHKDIEDYLAARHFQEIYKSDYM